MSLEMKCRFSGLEELSRQFAEIGKAGNKAARKMLKAGGQEAEKAQKEAAAMHGHIDTGAMIASIKAGTPKVDQDGGSVTIFPQGVDGHGVRNVEKAFILHYGSSRIQGSRWFDDADRMTEERAIPAMEKIWDEFIGG